MGKINFDLVEAVVTYFNENRSTVRKTGNYFGISKSTVHRYLTQVMPNKTSAEILATNLSERHLRGGEATKNKYLSMRL